MPRKLTNGDDFDRDHSPFNELLANLASLNEIVNALFSGLAIGERVDERMANLVFQTLREHSWRLGFAFNEEVPPPDWYVLRNREPGT